MRMPDIIKKKRDGYELTKSEINYFIEGCVSGEIPDYQISALLMAIYFSSMSDEEIVNLTLAIRDSGDRADLSKIEGIKVDKHSTGGVGDKTTLIVVPIVACCGVKVAKMSGRGLGHTGGTVDKLESIPGFRTNIAPDELADNVNKYGLSVTGQSGNLCPADKKLYALRDVTGTVESIPLIASSIMSKKLADGADCILLDVKTGSGSFMKSKKDAEKLAKTMVKIGNDAGTKTAALITNMDSPLGKMVGNSLEVIEAAEVLRGDIDNDLFEVCKALSVNMLMLADIGDEAYCEKLVMDAVLSGRAYEKLKLMILAQGGDASYIDSPEKFRTSKYQRTVKSHKTGFISKMDSEKIGNACVVLGAGRVKKEDDVNHAAGIKILKKTGDYVTSQDELAILFTDDVNALDDAQELYLSSLEFALERAEKADMILEKII